MTLMFLNGVVVDPDVLDYYFIKFMFQVMCIVSWDDARAKYTQ